MRLLRGIWVLAAVALLVSPALGDTLQYFLNQPSSGVNNVNVQPIDISPNSASQWYNYKPFPSSEYGGPSDIDGNGSSPDLQNKQLTMGLIQNGPSGEVQFFAIFGDPVNDGTTFRVYELTMTNLPYASDSSFAVSDDGKGVGMDTREFGTRGPNSVWVRRGFTDNQTDGFVMRDLVPGSIPGVINFDLDAQENPCLPLSVVWLRGNGDPIILNEGLSDVCNFEVDWSLNVTPEPGSLAVLLLGLGALGLRRRRRKK